jgi:hypothetical protein
LDIAEICRRLRQRFCGEVSCAGRQAGLGAAISIDFANEANRETLSPIRIDPIILYLFYLENIKLNQLKSLSRRQESDVVLDIKAPLSCI